MIRGGDNDGSIGGKGENLRALQRAGFEVPEWFAVPASVDDVAGYVRERLFGEDALVAVRSSAGDEDGGEHSFAGLHESFLFVRGLDAVVEAVAKVRASARTERALAYRAANGLDTEDARVAVLVQRMIHARTSGVVFTADPVRGDTSTTVVSALWGAGEGLVARGFSADTFRVDKRTRAIDADIVEKGEAMVFAGGRFDTVRLEEPKSTAPCLSDDEVRAVADLAARVERHFGRPQDIEFAIDPDARIHLLQTRPITTVEEYGPAAGPGVVWDNSNIIESYSGVTSALTFSFIRGAYASVYESFSRVMGVPKKTIVAHRPMFRSMLGLFRGQVYYNLAHWYRLVGLFPGFRFNQGFLESMMGVREGMDVPKPAGTLRRWAVELPALLRLVVRSAGRFARLGRHVRKFEREFKRNYDHYAAMDFDALTPPELLATYERMERDFLARWQTPIVNDFYVMIFYGTLRKLCRAWCGDESGTLQNDLLSGEGGIESTEPTKMLMRLADLAREDAALRARILEGTPERLAREIPAAHPHFAKEIDRYLDLYGFRCMGELKLEEPSLRERPDFLYGILRNYVASRPPEMDGRRVRAEAEAKLELRGWRKRLFHRVLRAARAGVRNRENLRFARTRIFGLARDLFRAMGRGLAREGILDGADDVFHLTVDELRDYMGGTAVTTDLRGLAALRRAEFDGYREAEPPADRFTTHGMPYHRNRFRAPPAPASEDGGGLRGVGCCPGRVTGRVKVIQSPSDDMRLDGEILVAGRTDPGWVPLYPSAKGILIERGSILSHSAIVAREMGIPTIVGIPGLLERLRSGQVVEMDGAAGTVTIPEDGADGRGEPVEVERPVEEPAGVAS